MNEFDDYHYTKCGECHLFVDTNWAAFDDETGNRITAPFPLAEWVHLHRGTPEDEALDESHEPTPGDVATLAWWKLYGPPEMRARFRAATSGN